ncbi:Protein lin-52 [Caenorhabditis elegans]|uniref:Protein lin-52 n=2 Tax=Caenorhabditis elegans TaxID=6239 RepID=LIN52_CAEEL|nr:Protein lin-52 [Caenorhabditis elegans]Q10120.1 RecName: Full=Protein lin-52; AltName: Full=Abnormal cell lineage protein 52 [Caenorhabditis elegans]AAP85302.1 LIN-52 [Caenorhabditis elegans]CAA80188.1 Protein lin-52 [Caenorhabditis elegans]|eukprot:NP_001255033.1 Protein lin-52 [Caenorhabditis elegans]
MSRPLGFIGYEFGDDEMFVQQMIEKKSNAEQAKMLEQQKKMLECTETMPEESEPVPMKCLDFEEAFQSESVSKGYESPYKNISFLKEDAVTVNTMSHCPADDIAKLIRNIQNSVYTLGIEEARQCRRGKLLNVLKPTGSASPRYLQPTPPKNVAEETTGSQ